MKVSLYAAGSMNEMCLYLSLDQRVDRLWWGGDTHWEKQSERFSGTDGEPYRGKTNASRYAGVRMLPISSGMPLQWVSKLAGMKLNACAAEWSRVEWERRVRGWLGERLSLEHAADVSFLLGISEAGRGDMTGAEGTNSKVTDNSVTDDKMTDDKMTDDKKSAAKVWMDDVVIRSCGISVSEQAWMQSLEKRAERIVWLLKGRSLLSGELESMLREMAPDLESDWRAAAQLAYLQGQIHLQSAVEADENSRKKVRQESSRKGGNSGKRKTHRCVRCGSAAFGGPCASCGSSDCARCEACRSLGRSRSCELLLQGGPRPQVHAVGSSSSALNLDMNVSIDAGINEDTSEGIHRGLRSASRPPDLQARLARWKLSPAQTAAADLAVRFLEGKRQTFQTGTAIKAGRSADASGYAANDPSSRFLLWAVTGAGKTEMLFPLIESVRSRGGQVLVATPRRDVVLELAPRLRKAFPNETCVTLYGGSEERWRRGGLTLATTHQLLRFAQAFDLVVIDELDAFPFHGDPMLAYAAEICRAPEGKTVYLSATPPKELQRLVRSGRLACAKVPVRYHRHPLPVPELLHIPSLNEVLRRKKLPDSLLRRWRTSLNRGAQVFIFVPKIAFAEPLAALLRSAFAGVTVGATSSKDEERGHKVQSFRASDVRMLVTTTILERGVTVPRSDVYILEADSGLFDEASLVQMAGRAGRSADDPAGCVVFASRQKTRAQAGACRQIRRMNRLAKPFLLPQAANKGLGFRRLWSRGL